MMRGKTWHKPLHKRRIWQEMSILSKIVYYMEPFMMLIWNIWKQPLPYPTILKLMNSCVVLLIMLYPLIHCVGAVLSIYAEFQYIMERHFDINFPDCINLLKYIHQLINFKVANEKFNLFLLLYYERWRLLVIGIASSIDYIRLALAMVLGN